VPIFSNADALSLVKEFTLNTQERILRYVVQSKQPFSKLSRIVEMANSERDNTAAYYTRQDICFGIVNNLPEAKDFDQISIMEPSIGVGNFLPCLIEKYSSVSSVNIDVVDINPASIELLKEMIAKMNVPDNFKINYIVGDFLLYDFKNRYDIVIGNPPYMKLTKDKKLAAQYKASAVNKYTNNIFAFFIEKALTLGDYVSLIVPKSLINAPEFNTTRKLMNQYSLTHLIDFGEKAFKGVKIETLSFTINTKNKPGNTIIYSYINNSVRNVEQSYITDSQFPYWLLYRNSDFDEIASSMEFGIFKAYRDRVITKSVTKQNGQFRVLKSRNIGNNEIIDIPEYDCYVDDVGPFDVSKYLNHTECVLLPNLTYNPRACFMPENSIADGSVAILTLCNEDKIVSPKDLEFYSSKEFSRFYAIARNLGTRSLNIDNNSVFFFGKLINAES
jgi:DNA (cytosine-5)-methyltransferase 1